MTSGSSGWNAGSSASLYQQATVSKSRPPRWPPFSRALTGAAPIDNGDIFYRRKRLPE